VFPVRIETRDPLVQFGSLGVGHGHVLVVDVVPKGLDQIEPLARRESGQLGCQITHLVQDDERSDAGQLAFRPAATVGGEWPW